MGRSRALRAHSRRRPRAMRAVQERQLRRMGRNRTTRTGKSAPRETPKHPMHAQDVHNPEKQEHPGKARSALLSAPECSLTPASRRRALPLPPPPASQGPSRRAKGVP